MENPRLSDRETLKAVSRRFGLLSGAMFAALVGVLLAASWVGLTGPMSNFHLTYAITVSAIAAVTFGGLYVAVSVLRSSGA